MKLGACIAVWICAGNLWFSPHARAHESPEHRVEELTREMDKKGRTAKRLFDRANEYRAMAKLALAAADLEESLRIDPASLETVLELSQVYLSLEQPEKALPVVTRGLGLRLEPAQSSNLHMIRARIHRVMGHYELALKDCNEAFRHPYPNPDWYLVQSEILVHLGLMEARVTAMRKGFERTGSVVLEEEWIDALIDAKQFEKALDEIRPQLVNCRWRSQWLIRRGRAQLGLGREKQAREDFLATIEEINQRLNRRHPDLFLLTDRGLAYALLDQRDEALHDLEEAKKLGAQEWIVQRLENTLERPAGF